MIPFGTRVRFRPQPTAEYLEGTVENSFTLRGEAMVGVRAASIGGGPGIVFQVKESACEKLSP